MVENKLLKLIYVRADKFRSASVKRQIKMSRRNRAARAARSKYFTRHNVSREEQHIVCNNFVRHASEAFLFILLFFTLPPTVYGIANMDAAKPNENIMSAKSISTSDETHFLPNRSIIVEMFEWKFVDVSAECVNFIGPKGYAAVQLSPVTEHLLGGVQAQSWVARYQPISYKFATRSGSVGDFIAMSRACNAAGVRVYVDVVLNHMAGVDRKTTVTGTEDMNSSVLYGTAGSMANISTLDYNGVPFDAMDFHKACVLQNYFDSSEVRNCQLNGQPDLNHSSVNVQQRTVEFLNELIEMGVAGFRIDAAKYMWPNELKVIYESVNNLNSEDFGFAEHSRPFFYQEVVDIGIDAISKTEYSGLGIVTEYLFAAELSMIFQGKVPLSSLINWGPAMGFLPHDRALVFVDTHDTQHGHLERELGKIELLNYKQQRRYVMGTTFMIAHPYGRVKRILSSYAFPKFDKERGPPTTTETAKTNEEPNRIVSPKIDSSNEQCSPENGWICEHRWPAIVNMLALANVLTAMDDDIIDFQTDGPNHIAFCRGRKAFIAINNDENLDYTATVRTCLETGIYCDIISGGKTAGNNDCQGKRIVVDENGMTDLALPAMSNARTSAIDTANVDADNTDDVDDDADPDGVWKGVAVDVDYGVIAIYIGSKLEINDERVWNAEVAEEAKMEGMEGMEKGKNVSIPEINADEFQVESSTDENNAAAGSQTEFRFIDAVGEEKSNIENAVEAKTENEMNERNATGKGN